jgi:putative glutamine amidotransferase
MQPLIGITTSRHSNHAGWRYFKGYAANAEAIVRVGGLPVFIPLGMPDDVVRAIYERLDGVLLPGGGDIDPDSYGAVRHELTAEVDSSRDKIEIQLARWAVKDDLPMLGICRGHQVLNVALGGSMVQDIGTEVATDVKHDIRFDRPRTTIAHTVTVEGDSQLAKVVGGTTISVNSLHHQAVTRVGDNVRIVAQSPDGIIEGVEVSDKFFIMSVQWHPEDLVDHEDSAYSLFAAFVEAAKARMGKVEHA